MKLARRPALAGMLALCAATAARAQAAPLDGEWWGLLTIAGTPYRFRVVLGGNAGVLYSVDEGAVSYPLDNVAATADGLAFGIVSLGVTYRGTREGAAITGDYGFLGQVFRVTFRREPLAYPTPFPDGEPDAGLAGEWFAGGGPYGPRVKLTVAGNGAALDFYEQGREIVPEVRALNGPRIFLRIPGANASYLGRLVDGRIVGTMTQAGSTQPLTFHRSAADASTVEPLTQAKLDELLGQSGAPALAAAAAGGPKSLSLVAGVRSASAPDPATTHDSWHLGSTTKSMTATLVARLAEAGRLSWDDTVGTVLGAAIPEMRADFRDATFRHLCSHRAGLIGDLPREQFARFARPSPDVRADRIATAGLALQAEPLGALGQAYSYSNMGYVVVGAMLETITGERWEDLIVEHVFRPLGMDRASPGRVAPVDQPVGHTLDATGALVPLGNDVVDVDVLEYYGPAGRVNAPLDEVLRYLAAHRDRTAFLRPESWNILHTPPFGGDYAMGWVVRPDGLWHNGSIRIWYAEMLFDPKRGVSAVVASNLGPVGGVGGAVRAALASAVQATTP